MTARAREGWPSVSPGLIAYLSVHAYNNWLRDRDWDERTIPVTTGLVAVSAVIHLRPGFLDELLPTIDEAWMDPYLVLENKDAKRFFLSPFYHHSEVHLVHDMISLLLHGTRLETSLGSIEFCSAFAALFAMSQGFHLCLAKSFQSLNDGRPYYYCGYSTGFSGIILAMKTVRISQLEDGVTFSGFSFSFQVMADNGSIAMTFGSVLAGFLYSHLKSPDSERNPLTYIIRGITIQNISRVLQLPFRFIRSLYRRRQSSSSENGSTGNEASIPSSTWRCSSCTHENSSLLTLCEMCNASNSEEDLAQPQPANANSSNIDSLNNSSNSGEEVSMMTVPQNN